MTNGDENKNGDQETNRRRKRTLTDLLNDDDLDDEDFLTELLNNLHDEDFLSLSPAFDRPSRPPRLSPAQQPFPSLSAPPPQSQALILYSQAPTQQQQLAPTNRQLISFYPSARQPLPLLAVAQSPLTRQPQGPSMQALSCQIYRIRPQPHQEPRHLTHRQLISFSPPARQSSLAPPLAPQSQELSMQELFSQTPPQGPVQLATSHPLYTPLFPPADSPAASPLYPQEFFLTRNAPFAGKSLTVPAPFPWATNYRAKVHNLEFLLSNQIFTITGEVQCKRCEKKYEIEHDVRQKFMEVRSFIAENMSSMNHRAPSIWTKPFLPTCKYCGQENSVKPVMAAKKRKINWLFLLLGQMLGCCTLPQLKYFCKHYHDHRTGKKDRLLFLTYLGLCKQVDPENFGAMKFGLINDDRLDTEY